MVVERTLRKIEALKERPHHERRAIAAAVALGVVAVLFVGWGLGAYRSLGASGVEPIAEESATIPSATSTGARVRLEGESAAASAATGYILMTDDGYQVVPEVTP